ncbi:MAG TPA: transposase [Candidatus Sulfotelmatobacter sp.]|nr:transposase [Candidatus Sulfotelmatobacter sp.]
MSLRDHQPQRVRDWPHGPAHRVSAAGAYMVTAGTYLKLPVFQTSEALTFLTNLLLELAESYDWRLEAWAVFPNHYHFLGESQKDDNLKGLIRELHSKSAMEINQLDGIRARKVWFQYWESRVTFHKSFLARLNYVHQNPVRHRAAFSASAYPWCSAGWFERRATPSFYRAVHSFPVDRLEIPDDFEVTLSP